MGFKIGTLVAAFENLIASDESWLSAVDRQDYIRGARDVTEFCQKISEVKERVADAKQYLEYINGTVQQKRIQLDIM